MSEVLNQKFSSIFLCGNKELCTNVMSIALVLHVHTYSKEAVRLTLITVLTERCSMCGTPNAFSVVKLSRAIIGNLQIPNIMSHVANSFHQTIH